MGGGGRAEPWHCLQWRAMPGCGVVWAQGTAGSDLLQAQRQGCSFFSKTCQFSWKCYSLLLEGWTWMSPPGQRPWQSSEKGQGVLRHRDGRKPEAQLLQTVSRDPGPLGGGAAGTQAEPGGARGATETPQATEARAAALQCCDYTHIHFTAI